MRTIAQIFVQGNLSAIKKSVMVLIVMMNANYMNADSNSLNISFPLGVFSFSTCKMFTRNLKT